MFGREPASHDARAVRARQWVRQRSPLALVAGVLGIFAPLDGLVFFPLSIAAVVLGILGFRDIRRNPSRQGRRLCALGIVGGLVGITLAVTLQLWRR